MAPDGLTAAFEAYPGTILGGAREASVAAETENPLGMHWQVELMFVQHMPEPGLASLAARLQLIAHPGQANPIQGAPLLAVGGQYALGEEVHALWEDLAQGSAGRSGLWYEQSGMLATGDTAYFQWQLSEEITDPDNFLREWPERQPVAKRFALALEAQSWLAELAAGNSETDPSDPQSAPPSIQLQPAFFIADLARPRDEEEESGTPPEGGRPGGRRMQQEWVLPAIQLSKDHSAALFLLPNPFESLGAKVLAVRLSAQAGPVAPTDPDSHQAARSTEAQPNADFSPALTTLAQLQNPEGVDPIDLETLRGSLLYLAAQAPGSLSQDLVLTGEEAQLRSWLTFVPAASDLEESTWAWALERAAWVSLARLQIKDQLPREYRALLLRLAGEVGQYPSTIEAAALQSADLATFEKRLQAENLLFLDDSNPGARVRAFDWLQTQGVEIPDFDPLGSKQARRVALRALEAAGQDSGESQ